MKNLQKGFTLIELMIVVAIIAILAAIAIPQYQNYTIRAKVSELVVAADACKTSVSEYFQSQGTLPPSQTVSGCATSTSQYVSGLVVTPNTGVITVTASTTAGRGLPTAAAGNITLTPTSNGANNPLNWACAGSIPNQYLPATCRH